MRESPRTFCVAITMLLTALGVPDVAHAGPFTLPIPPTLTSYWNNGVENVIYIDISGEIVSLSYNTNTHGPWTTTVLATAGTFVPGSPLLAYVDNHGTGRIFFYVYDSGNGAMEIGEQRGNPPSGNFINLTVATGRQSWPQALNTEAGSAHMGFTNGRGAEVPQSLIYPSNLVGFQDGLGTHHVFFFGNPSLPLSSSPTLLVQLYSSDSADANWYTTSIASVTPTPGNTPIGLTALWDGSVQHVYWNPSPTSLAESYNDGSWWSHTLSFSNWNAPYYNVTAVSPVTGWQYLWGANAPIGLGATAAEWLRDPLVSS